MTKKIWALRKSLSAFTSESFFIRKVFENCTTLSVIKEKNVREEQIKDYVMSIEETLHQIS